VVHAHDGFYLHLAMGIGLTSVSSNGASYSGTSTAIAAAGGVVVAPNLIIYGKLVDLSISNASGTMAGTPGSSADVEWLGVGPGLAYYIEPLNLYLGGTVAFSRASYGSGSSSGTGQITNWGLGGELLFGKEWWASQNWGLGLAGEVVLSSARDRTAMFGGGDWTTAGFNLLFSATYN
jgi:hypothetical protein